MHDACLDADLDMLPNGDMTEVGERVCFFLDSQYVIFTIFVFA